MEGEVRMPASTHLVGTTVGTVSLAPVGWVGFGEVLHTLTYNDVLSSMNSSFMLFLFFFFIAITRVHGAQVPKSHYRLLNTPL